MPIISGETSALPVFEQVRYSGSDRKTLSRAKTRHRLVVGDVTIRNGAQVVGEPRRLIGGHYQTQRRDPFPRNKIGIPLTGYRRAADLVRVIRTGSIHIQRDGMPRPFPDQPDGVFDEAVRENHVVLQHQMMAHVIATYSPRTLGGSQRARYSIGVGIVNHVEWEPTA